MAKLSYNKSAVPGSNPAQGCSEQLLKSDTYVILSSTENCDQQAKPIWVRRGCLEAVGTKHGYSQDRQLPDEPALNPRDRTFDIA